MYTCLYIYALVCLCLIYVICFFIIIFIAFNHIISLTQKNLFFGHVCQKFSLRILLSFCLIFANFSLALLIKVLLIKKNVRTTNSFSMLSYEIELLWSGMLVMEYQQVSDMALQYIAILFSLNSFQRIKANEIKQKILTFSILLNPML